MQMVSNECFHIHLNTVLQVDLHFCNLLLNQDSLILKKYSVFQHKVLVHF